MSRVRFIGELYRMHATLLRRALRRNASLADVEEDVQTGFLNVVRFGTGEISNPKALLARAVLNARTDRTRLGSSRVAAQAVALDECNLSVAADQEQALVLKQVILGLPEPLRTTFILNRFGGLSYGEIAEHQGVTAKAVEYRMSRALALCRAALQD